MDTKQKLKHAKQQEQHWQEISGIVFDVAALLENLGRINSRQLCAYDVEQLSRIRQGAALVASHALKPVIAALNDEHHKWMFEELSLTP